MATFMSPLTPEEPVDSNENYWRLLDICGQIIELGKELFTCKIRMQHQIL
jgi:hypothetical protein